MALPINFNNTAYAAGFFGTDDGGASAAFNLDDVSTYSVSVTGRVTQPGDTVVLTYGANAPTGYANTSVTLTATQYDNANMIEFSSTAIPPGNTQAGNYRYVLSNTQMYGSNPPAGATRTRFTADDNTVGSYTPPATTAPTNPTPPATNAPCYCTGTRILTDRGEVSVEDLSIGDVAVTASGQHRPIRWIGTRSYLGCFANANPAVLPVCVTAGALADGVPARDLWVSPDHALFLDGVLIPAERLVNGASITKAERIESVTYWHVELDSHDVLLTEGAPAESFVDDGGRAIFHNAAEYRALYPHAPAWFTPAVYCASRVADGYALETVRRRLALRAGLPVTTARVFGELRGHLDLCDGRRIAGWAQDLSHPDGPVCLDILVDGTVVAMAYAETQRADLEAARIGDGCHAFDLELPFVLDPAAPHSVSVRRSADGTVIGSLLIQAVFAVAA